MKQVTSLFIVSLLSGAVTLGAYKLFIEKKSNQNAVVTSAQSNYSKIVKRIKNSLNHESSDVCRYF